MVNIFGIFVWRVTQTLGLQDGSEPGLCPLFITYSRLELLELRHSTLSGFVSDLGSLGSILRPGGREAAGAACELGTAGGVPAVIMRNVHSLVNKAD